MYLLYLTFPLFYYFTNQSLIIMLMVMDNLFLSYNTISKIYNYPLIKFYEASFIDRYIYYVIISLLNPIFYLMLYTDITAILFISTIPPLFSLILDYINPLLVLIKHDMNKIKKHMMYALIGYFLKLICLTTLKIDPCFNKKEIALLCKENYKEHVLLLIKNFIIVTVMKAISNEGTISLTIVKKLYNTKAIYQYKDPLPNIKENVEKLKTIILKRNFKLLFNPYILDVIIKLYEHEPIDQMIPKVNTFFNDLELCTAKMLTVVTLSKLWGFYFLIGIISFTLSPVNRKNLIIKLIGTLISYLSDNYYIGCMICEYSDLLLSNVSDWLFIQCTKLYKNNIHVITHLNKYNDMIIINVSYLYLLSQYLVDDYLKILILCYVIANAKYPLLSLYFITCGYLSHYAFHHLCLLGLFLYLFINLSHFKYAPLPKIPLTLITNYKEEPIKDDKVVNDTVVDQDIPTINTENIPIKDESSIPVKSGSTIPFKDGSSIPVKDGSSIPVKDGSSIPSEFMIPKYYPIKITNQPKQIVKRYDHRCHVLNNMHNPKYILAPK